MFTQDSSINFCKVFNFEYGSTVPQRFRLLRRSSRAWLWNKDQGSKGRLKNLLKNLEKPEKTLKEGPFSTY
jgi:hypothetical protein